MNEQPTATALKLFKEFGHDVDQDLTALQWMENDTKRQLGGRWLELENQGHHDILELLIEGSSAWNPERVLAEFNHIEPIHNNRDSYFITQHLESKRLAYFKIVTTYSELGDGKIELVYVPPIMAVETSPGVLEPLLEVQS